MEVSKKALTSNSVCNMPMRRETQVYSKKALENKKRKWEKIMRAEREKRSHNTKQQKITYTNKERREAKWKHKRLKRIKKYILIIENHFILVSSLFEENSFCWEHNTSR